MWPKIEKTAGEDVARFLLDASTTEDWDQGFRRRLPWFGYLGAQSDEDLRKRWECRTRQPSPAEKTLLLSGELIERQIYIFSNINQEKSDR